MKKNTAFQTKLNLKLKRNLFPSPNHPIQKKKKNKCSHFWLHDMIMYKMRWVERYNDLILLSTYLYIILLDVGV